MFLLNKKFDLGNQFIVVKRIDVFMKFENFVNVFIMVKMFDKMDKLFKI